MKRDKEVVREILCGIANAEGKTSSAVLTAGKTPEEAKIIVHHIDMLYDADLVAGTPARHHDGTQWVNLALTLKGQDEAEKILATPASGAIPVSNPLENPVTETKLRNALICKPSIYGVGIDLGKVWQWVRGRCQKTK